MMQHILANAAREATSWEGSSVAAHVAGAAGGVDGLSADRQQRLMRGETMAQYADIAYWASHFPFVASKLTEYIESWHAQPEQSRAGGMDPRRR
ncbi:hypothetical protein RWH45_06675 [Microbacterium sp. KSW4-17]|uniref:Uncharacterized protein n=1 Tax=Microbacterium galbum TaxID=3075994 RepID=A0ABU3T690_9MICO|nr:hypothetical protein [Microbacterium sp. KSW4-17]MDU0366894.1 hypothetical protein [Microbacterium sp. KSW4-17]